MRTLSFPTLVYVSFALSVGCAGSSDVGETDNSDENGAGTGGLDHGDGDAPGDGGSDGSGASSSGTGGENAGGPGSGGGPIGSGGTASSGGAPPAGCTNVRPTGTEWDEATCDQWASETSECGETWMVENDYCNQSCGRCSSTSSGGSNSGSGGDSSSSSGSPITSNCSEGSQQVCENDIGTHCGYTYEYWKDQGTGCLTNTNDGFDVEWNNINNLLGRKGIRPGSESHVVTYSATYNPNGNSYLCVYGWSQGPLAEYYIVDSWGDWRPPGGTPLGTVQSDGGTYDIYRTLRENQPSIEGIATFPQYWSVRQAKRESGTITVKNHFDAWANQGMNMGSIYEVSMTVEGYQSSGSANVTLSIE